MTKEAFTDRILYSLIGLVLYILASWWIDGYLLASTYPFSPFDLGTISSDSVFMLERMGGQSSKLAFLLVAFSCPILWFTYLMGIRRSPHQWTLWSTGIVYFSLMSATDIIREVHRESTVRCALLIWAIFSGLITARICSTAERTAKVLCFFATIHAVYALAMMYGTHMFVSGTVVRAGGIFGDPAAFYPLVMMCLPLAIALCIRQSHMLIRIFWGISALVIGLALVATWYRGGIAGIAVGLTWFAYHKTKRWMPTIGTGLGLGLVALYTFLLRVNGPLNQASSDGSLHGRYRIWQLSIKQIMEHWATGIGIGNTVIHTTDVYKGHVMYLEFPHTHNLLLQWMVEMGVGGGVLLTFFVVAIYEVIKHSDDVMALGLGASWLAVLVAGIVDVPFGVSQLGLDQFTPNNAIAGAMLGAIMLIKSDPRNPVVTLRLPSKEHSVVETGGIRERSIKNSGGEIR